METSAPRSGYGPSTTVGAILATFFFPLIALIAALIMLGGQSDPQKGAFLRDWALVSLLWLVVPVVLLIWLSR